MAVDFGRWRGSLSRRGEPVDPPVITVAVKPSPRGGSGTFLAADSEGERWWVKPLNNEQGERVAVTEAVVGAVGALIGAPVCDSAIVFLPPEIEGWEFRPGAGIVSGYAHASRGVDDAVEHRSLLYRDRDDNARRHVGVFAIYDWCWGGDDQWLYAETEDRMLYSHDHGWYLPETGPTWNVEALIARVGQAHVARWPPSGLDGEIVATCSERLRTLTRDDLLSALSRIPDSWPVDGVELERVGWFLESRAPQVADRLESIGGRL